MKNNLRVILAKRREKISHMAREVNISRNTLTEFYYERIDNPRYKTIKTIADYLNVTVEELMTVEEEGYG